MHGARFSHPLGNRVPVPAGSSTSGPVPIDGDGTTVMRVSWNRLTPFDGLGISVVAAALRRRPVGRLARDPAGGPVGPPDEPVLFRPERDVAPGPVPPPAVLARSGRPPPPITGCCLCHSPDRPARSRGCIRAPAHLTPRPSSASIYEQLLICSKMTSAIWSRSTSPACGSSAPTLVAPDAVQGLADTFSALGDPTRVRILDALSHGELCVCDLAAVLGLSQSAVSHQLRLLRGIRLVQPRREGRDRLLFARRSAHHFDLQADAAARRRRCARPRQVARRDTRPSAEGADELTAITSAALTASDAPKPTGARVRGWFTGVAAALAIAGCGIGMSAGPGVVGRRAVDRRHRRRLGVSRAARVAIDPAAARSTSTC